MRSKTPAGESGGIVLTPSESGLVARVEAAAMAAPTQFAFYLYRAGQRVATRWYADDATAVFPQATVPGRYAVTAFARPADGARPAWRIGSAEWHLASGPDGDTAARPGQAPASTGRRAQKMPPARPVDGLVELGQAIEPGAEQRLDVTLGDFVYPLLKHPVKGDAMFVVLGGAVPDRATIELPRFNRFTWRDDFPGTLVCIADPTLTLDPALRLGWYVGSADDDVTEGLARIVEKLADLLGIRLENVYTYGSSGGGFAALQLAARLGRGVTAVAINAQTQVLDYSVRRSVEQFLAASLGGMPAAQARQRFATRLSALEAWQQPAAAGARCLLVQNLDDPHHHERHFKPFCQRFGIEPDGQSADGRMGSMLYRHDDGHAAEPRPMLGAILERAFRLRPAAASAGEPALAAGGATRPMEGIAAPVVIHVGLPKTGTTYLQRTFHQAFGKSGQGPLDYPDVGFYNHQIALYEPLGRFLPWKVREVSSAPWQRLQAAWSQPGERPLLLSAEALSALDAEGVAEFRRLLGDRPVERIVITTRALATLLPSHWQQNMKQGGRGDLASYAQRILDAVDARRSPSQMFSFRETIRLWRTQFPDTRFSVLVMDGSHTQNLICFARLCGLGPEHDERLLASVPTAAEQNLSFSVEECRQLLVINERIARGQLPVAARRRAMDAFFRSRESGAHYDKPRLDAGQQAVAQAMDRAAYEAAAGDPLIEVLHGGSEGAIPRRA